MWKDLLGLAVLVSSWATQASAASACDYFYNSVEMFDNFYASRWGCQQVYINDMWSRFDFDKEDWDGIYGYNDPCNVNKPLMRTFNALQVMAYAATDTPTCSTSSSNVLHWAYCWSGNAIDELDARGGTCRRDGKYAGTAFDIGDDYTRLYWPFFYGENVIERAATIFHEARHAQGHCRHDGTRCLLSGACDTSWGSGCTGFRSAAGKGSYAYEVLFLNWFATTARSWWTSDTIRSKAIATANWILRANFDADPCFRLNSQGFLVQSC